MFQRLKNWLIKKWGGGTAEEVSDLKTELTNAKKELSAEQYASERQVERFYERIEELQNELNKANNKVENLKAAHTFNVVHCHMRPVPLSIVVKDSYDEMENLNMSQECYDLYIMDEIAKKIGDQIVRGNYLKVETETDFCSMKVNKRFTVYVAPPADINIF